MNRSAILAALAPLVLGACAELNNDNNNNEREPGANDRTAHLEEDHAPLDFVAQVDGAEHTLTYEGTHDVMEDRDPDVTRVVFVHHGAAQNPVTYFDDAVSALRKASEQEPESELRRRTMVISPAKIGQGHVEDHPDRYADRHYPYWPGGWREGEESLNEPTVSNFDLLDAMALHVAQRFPSLESMVFAGHSAGGQVMSRYAVGTTAYDQLVDQGVDVRFVISNPSSFLYLDRRRPDLDDPGAFIQHTDALPTVEGEPCSDFNEYRYGFEGDVAEYMTRREAEALVEDFRDREVFILQGADDNDPEGAALDRSCPAMTQGRHRLERGERYYDYLGDHYGSEVYETTFLEVVPDVGHSHAGIFASEAGLDILFRDDF